MDSGYVIPTLDEGWTLLGVKAQEWGSGFLTSVLVMQIFFPDKPTRAAPLLLVIICFVAFGFASLRRRFPDEEKGVLNYFCCVVGVAPPRIPAPAAFQPVWSGAPLRELKSSTEFVELGLDAAIFADQLEEPEEESGSTR